MKLPIYLDHHATTPVDARVLSRMLPYFRDHFGNAASHSHAFGWRAEEAVDVARRQVASLLGAEAQEIIFTSGATESNNLALFGIMASHPQGHVVTQCTEHKAVLDVCRKLERDVKVTYLPVDGRGWVDPDAVAAALTPQTVLVSVMHVNNEVGTIQPIAEIGTLCRQRGIVFHTDAAQSAGLLPLDVQTMPLDLISFSAHKMYGPKGVGALYVRRRQPRVSLLPLMHGGGHERNLRPGTLNVPGVVGMGEACALAQAEGAARAGRLAELRDRLQARIQGDTTGVLLNGHLTARHPGNLNLSFSGVEGDTLLLSLRDVAVSSGSACTSATLEPSYVLRAMGVADDLARASIRFGVGCDNTVEEMDYVAELVVKKLQKVRRLG